MSALTVIEQRGHVLGAGTAEWQLGPAERLVVAGKAIWFYAAKVVWPTRLTFVYPRWAVDSSSLWSCVPIAAVVALGVTLWRCRSRAWCRAVMFGGGFFVVALFPVLGFLDVYYFRFSYVADHFQYLACIGLISLAVGTGSAICERAGPWGKDLGIVAAAAVLVMLGVSTWKRAHVYQDSETLWRDTVTRNPNAWMAHSNLGMALAQTGKIEEAIAHFEQALRINPDNAEAYNNLGMALAQTGKIEEAITHYQQALRITPDRAEVHYNLGSALAQAGRVREAIVQYEQALRIKPDFSEARNALARLQPGR